MTARGWIWILGLGACSRLAVQWKALSLWQRRYFFYGIGCNWSAGRGLTLKNRMGLSESWATHWGLHINSNPFCLPAAVLPLISGPQEMSVVMYAFQLVYLLPALPLLYSCCVRHYSIIFWTTSFEGVPDSGSLLPMGPLNHGIFVLQTVH